MIDVVSFKDKIVYSNIAHANKQKKWISQHSIKEKTTRNSAGGYVNGNRESKVEQ